MNMNAIEPEQDAVAIVDRLQHTKREALMEELLKLPEHIFNTTHAINGGMYARTGLVPAGVAFTGAVHLKDHICIVDGDISVTSQEGVQRLTGRNIFTMKAGHGRSGYAHSDTVWTTIVATNLTDLAEIENECVLSPETLQSRRLQLVEGTKLGELS
jgi:hypothetical protein